MMQLRCKGLILFELPFYLLTPVSLYVNKWGKEKIAGAHTASPYGFFSCISIVWFCALSA